MYHDLFSCIYLRCTLFSLGVACCTVVFDSILHTCYYCVLDNYEYAGFLFLHKILRDKYVYRKNFRTLLNQLFQVI